MENVPNYASADCPINAASVTVENDKVTRLDREIKSSDIKMQRWSRIFSSPSVVEEVVEQQSDEVGGRREERQDPGFSRRGAHDGAYFHFNRNKFTLFKQIHISMSISISIKTNSYFLFLFLFALFLFLFPFLIPFL
jgi:hypothetical protein